VRSEGIDGYGSGLRTSVEADPATRTARSQIRCGVIPAPVEAVAQREYAGRTRRDAQRAPLALFVRNLNPASVDLFFAPHAEMPLSRSLERQSTGPPSRSRSARGQDELSTRRASLTLGRSVFGSSKQQPPYRRGLRRDPHASVRRRPPAAGRLLGPKRPRLRVFAPPRSPAHRAYGGSSGGRRRRAPGVGCGRFAQPRGRIPT
jgi:hypothetical protein